MGLRVSMAENSLKIVKKSEEITKKSKRKRRVGEEITEEQKRKRRMGKEITKEPKRKRRKEIKLIENKDELHTTSTKRRQGLFKKDTELCDTCAAQAAVITSHSLGDACAQGHPELDPLLKRNLADHSSSVDAVDNGVILAPTLKDSEKKINEALGKGRPAWDAVTVTLGLSELDSMEKAIKYVKSKVKMCEGKTCVQN